MDASECRGAEAARLHRAQQPSAASLPAVSGGRYVALRRQLSPCVIILGLFALLPGPTRATAADAPAGPLPHATGDSAPSKEGASLAGQNLRSDSYAGIVVNQTMTVVGQDFFQYFIAAWRDKEMVDRYAIAVNERPSARLGSQIWISFGQQRVYQTFLPPTRAAIKSISLSAVDIVYQSVIEADVQKLLFKDLDLAPDEF